MFPEKGLSYANRPVRDVLRILQLSHVEYHTVTSCLLIHPEDRRFSLMTPRPVRIMAMPHATCL